MPTPDESVTVVAPDEPDDAPSTSPVHAVNDDVRHLRVISRRFRQLSPAGRAYARTMLVGDGR